MLFLTDEEREALYDLLEKKVINEGLNEAESSIFDRL